jgi:hypothetical protein
MSGKYESSLTDKEIIKTINEVKKAHPGWKKNQVVDHACKELRLVNCVTVGRLYDQVA